MPLNRRARRRKAVVFGSFVMSCLGASLLAAAFGTQYWYNSDSTSSAGGTGKVNFGLFEGTSSREQFSHTTTYTLRVVCVEGECMYSCADTKEHREDQLQMVLEGEEEALLDYCVDAKAVNSPSANLPPRGLAPVLGGSETGLWLQEEDDNTTETTTGTTTVEPLDPELMDYGLWVGTLTCLSLGLLFAVVAALFAIINTATTPVEAITGVPGLYLWNGLAALSDLVCVILWGVQYSLHLTSNVLLYDAANGWTTEGLQHLGYSYWLVVVAICVHLANIGIIFSGTYEAKAKEQLEAPETKGGNIMLY